MSNLPTNLGPANPIQDLAAQLDVDDALLAVLQPVTRNVDTAVLAAGGTQAVSDVTTATSHLYTFGAGNATLTFPVAGAGKAFVIALKQDGVGGRTITWPGTVKWPGGAAPVLTTTANKTDIFAFDCLDGTNWLGRTLGLNY